MDDKTWLGALAETKAVAAYTADRWDVFTQLSGKSPFDLVVYRNGELRKVQVKGTCTQSKYGSWTVQLRSVRSNRTTNVIKRLDASQYDELAIYIQPLDRIGFMTPSEVGSLINLLTLNAKVLSNLRSRPACQCGPLEGCSDCPRK